MSKNKACARIKDFGKSLEIYLKNLTSIEKYFSKENSPLDAKFPHCSPTTAGLQRPPLKLQWVTRRDEEGLENTWSPTGRDKRKEVHSSPQAILTLTAEECDGDECVSSFRLFCSAERRNMRISFKKCFFCFWYCVLQQYGKTLRWVTENFNFGVN